jgi:hypothetical protein
MENRIISIFRDRAASEHAVDVRICRKSQSRIKDPYGVCVSENMSDAWI